MANRKVSASGSGGTASKKQKPGISGSLASTLQRERLDPKLRGIHEDAITAGVAPSSRAVCVSCSRAIQRGEPRWGIKYAGNPLGSEPVLPLYGTHPMYMWCHAGGCGLAFVRLPPDDAAASGAARTCHLCSDAPDDGVVDGGVRLLCGGPSGAQNKVRQHAFHVGCWRAAILRSEELDEAQKRTILIDCREIGGQCRNGLSYDDLTESEQQLVRRLFEQSAEKLRREE